MDLPDGSPSFQDYMGSRNNRFTTPEAAAKNHILSEFVTAVTVYHVLNTGLYFSRTVCMCAFIEMVGLCICDFSTYIDRY